MKLLITIDTECDNAWTKSHEVFTKNARFLPRFQLLCDKYHYKPTYLVAYEMAKDEFFVEFVSNVLKRSACEVGSHLHAWYSPPTYNLTSDDTLFHPYLLEYPQEIIRQKLKILTDLLEDTFGRKMLSHRAGRWGLNATYARILAEFGYKVDCSVTPYKKWNVTARPPGDPPCPNIDFRNFPAEAYFPDAEDISKPGNLPILELPMTIIPNYGKLLLWLYSAIVQKDIQRAMRAVFGKPVSWFRPHRVDRELLRVANYKIKEEADYIMFMLHSSEFMPGGNPTFRNEKEVETLYEDIEQVFDFLKANGIRGVTCRQYYGYFAG